MPEKQKKTFEEYLKEQVKKSGYPLEIKVSNILDGMHYVVFNTEYHFDEEIQQGRDIDVYALPLDPDPMNDEILPFRLNLELAIECKKSETYAWVFYTRPRLEYSGICMSGQLSTTFPKRKQFSTDSADWFFEYTCLKTHYNNFDRIAIAYDELKKSKSNQKVGSHRNEIFEGTNQLVKFVNYMNHRREKRLSELPADLPYRENIRILFPIIIFDGDMFEVFFKGEEPMLWKTKHLLLSTHRYCPYCKESKSFTIDVVHRSYFEEFLNVLRTSFVKLNEIFSEKHDELLEKISNDRAVLEKEKEKSILK